MWNRISRSSWAQRWYKEWISGRIRIVKEIKSKFRIRDPAKKYSRIESKECRAWKWESKNLGFGTC
jgi:hypothetical protein